MKDAVQACPRFPLDFVLIFALNPMNTQKISRFLLYMLASSPAWMFDWSLYPTGWGKMPIVTLIIVVLAGLTLFQKREQSITSSKTVSYVQWALVAYLFVYLVAGIFGVDWWKSMWGEQSRQNGFFVLVHFVLLAFLLPKILRTKESWKNFHRVLVYTGVVVACVALLEAFVPAVRSSFSEVGRYGGWLGNPIYLGGYLAFIFFFAARLFVTSGIRERIAMVVSEVICIGGILVTGSRGPMLALISGIIIAAVAWLFLQEKTSKIRKIAVPAFVVLILASVGGVFLLRQVKNLPSGVSRIFTPANYLEEGTPRLLSWEIAWNGFLARPVLGWGPENFQIVFDRYYNPKLLKYSFYETVSDKPHNLFLEILTDGGVLLEIAYLSLFIAAFVATVRGVKRGVLGKADAACLIGGLVAYAVHSAFLFEIPQTSFLLFITFGFLLGTEQSVLNKMNGERKEFSYTAFAVLALILLVIVDVYAMGFGLYASFGASRALGADPRSTQEWDRYANIAFWSPSPYQTELRKIVLYDFLKRISADVLPADFVNRELPNAINAIEQSRKAFPNDFQLAFVDGQLLAEEGSRNSDPVLLTQAVDAFRAAKELSPDRQAVPLQLAKVLLIGDKAKDAVTLLQGVVNQDTSIAEPHWFLGLALIAAGDQKNGAAELQKSMTLGRGVKDNQETLYVIDILAKSERYSDIIPLYQLLIDQDPNNPDWHARLAATYAKAGKPELAILEAQKAADLDPSFAAEADAFIKSLQPSKQ